MITMRYKSAKKFLRNFPRLLVEFMQIAGIGCYDLYLHIKVKLYRENPIGVYVEILRRVEKKWFFPDNAAGGYCGLVVIKLFSLNEVCFGNEDSIIDILNHEVLHQVLDKVAGSKARHELDNVQRSFWIIDEQKRSRYTIAFALIKDGKVELIY